MLGVQSSEALIWRSHRTSWAKHTCRRGGTVTALLCRRQVIPLGLFIALLFTLQWRCTVNISAKFLLFLKKTFFLVFLTRRFFFLSVMMLLFSLRFHNCLLSTVLWLWVTKWWRAIVRCVLCCGCRGEKLCATRCCLCMRSAEMNRF